jgi:hypothetical protein
MNGWMVGRRLPRRERGRQQGSWGAGLSRRGREWCAGRRGWWASKKGKRTLIARPGHLGGSERGRSRFIHKAGSRHRDGPQGGWGTKPRSGIPNPCGPGSALREHGWRSVMVSVEWSLDGVDGQAALGEYGVQRSATAQGASKPAIASQSQPEPVKGSGWVEERAAWSPLASWIARPEGEVRDEADESRGETNPCHAPAAPKATRASGRGRMKSQTARAPSPFGQR